MLARIYRPSKTATQSGQAAVRHWILEFEIAKAPPSDALMGWTASADTRGQVRLKFDTKEQAIAYAQAHDLPHQVQEPRERTPIIKSYSDNFSFRRREPWSH